MTGVRPVDRLYDVVGHERSQMRLQTDRAHARSAAAVRNGEGLVQIHVADVSADVARRGEADLRVEIGAVHINLTAMRMNDRADVLDRFLEDAVRGRVGDHQAGEVGRILLGLGLEVGDIDVAAFIAIDDDDFQAAHLRGGRVGAVR